MWIAAISQLNGCVLNKLHSVKPLLGYSNLSSLSRQDAVVLRRLRIGHTPCQFSFIRNQYKVRLSRMQHQDAMRCQDPLQRTKGGLARSRWHRNHSGELYYALNTWHTAETISYWIGVSFFHLTYFVQHHYSGRTWLSLHWGRCRYAAAASADRSSVAEMPVSTSLFHPAYGRPAAGLVWHAACLSGSPVYVQTLDASRSL